MTGELGECRGWAGETEGVDRSLLGRPWQGSSGGVGRWSELMVLVLRLHGRQPRVGDKLVWPGSTNPVTLANPCLRPPSLFPPPQHGISVVPVRSDPGWGKAIRMDFLIDQGFPGYHLSNMALHLGILVARSCGFSRCGARSETIFPTSCPGNTAGPQATGL